MPYLHRSAAAWQSNNFSVVLIEETLQLGLTDLPLQKALTYGNYASPDNITIMLLSSRDNELKIDVKLGVFFTSIITGCQCADDPSPLNEQNEYCEIQISIHKHSAETTINLLHDEDL